MPHIDLTTPNEPYDERIKNVEGGSTPPAQAERPEPPPTADAPGHRLGPAAGVEMEGTQNAASGAPERIAPDHDRLPRSHEGGPTHPNTYGLSGTRTTGGFDQHPGRHDHDALRISADAPLPGSEDEADGEPGGMAGAGQGSGTSPMPKNHSTRHSDDVHEREDPGTGDPSLGTAT
jgi:hypothetical protein